MSDIQDLKGKFTRNPYQLYEHMGAGYRPSYNVEIEPTVLIEPIMLTTGLRKGTNFEGRGLSQGFNRITFVTLSESFAEELGVLDGTFLTVRVRLGDYDPQKGLRALYARVDGPSGKWVQELEYDRPAPEPRDFSNVAVPGPDLHVVGTSRMPQGSKGRKSTGPSPSGPEDGGRKTWTPGDFGING